MLGTVPPIVVLPSNPAHEVLPVPVFSRTIGLYGPLKAEPRDNNPTLKAVVSNMGGGGCISVPHGGKSRGDGALPQVENRETKLGCPQGALPNGHNHCLTRVTGKEVDELLEVLDARYQKYVMLKQQRTERYLSRIETHVDCFLSGKYRSGASLFGGGVTSFIKSKLPGSLHFSKASVCIKNTGAVCRGGPMEGEVDNRANSGMGALPCLQECFYTPQCIPFDYLDVRPENMGAIAANLVVLQHCLAECVAREGLGRSELLEPIIRDVWEKELNPLHRDATDLIQVAQNNVWPPLEWFASRSGDTQVVDKQRSKYNRVVKGLQGDLHYLETIREMDRMLVDGRSAGVEGGSSDYVPVGGLALSRLHRLENEHRTVLEFWQSR